MVQWPVPRSLATISLALALSLGPAGSGAFGQDGEASSTRSLVAPSRAVSPELAEAALRARALLDSVREAAGIPGLSAAVGAGGRVVWADGFGLADLENRVPVTPLTKFRIGSVSKPLTAVAVGLLHQEGALDLDAPVQRYVPAFPEKRWPITTRLLAGHLAGVRHYRDLEFLSPERYESVGEGLEIFAADSLLFEPGTRYEYSSYGWNLVSAVVEGASDEPFLPFMRRRVLGPLGLRHTVADHTDSLIADRTSYYHRREDGSLRNAPYVDNSYKWAGGGYLSTPEDLVLFALSHVDGNGPLEPETSELLWTSQRTADGEETGYGIGWRVEEDEAGRRMVFHGGGSIGGTTMLLLYPEEALAVALVANLTGASLGRSLAEAVAAPFLEAEPGAAGPGEPGARSGEGGGGQ